MARTSYEAPALSAAIRLVELLCGSERPMGVAEIARELGSSSNMVFRLLQVLCAHGWVVKEPPGPSYRMTLRPFHYTSMTVDGMDLTRAAAGPVRDLWTCTGECSYLGVLDGDRVLYLITHAPTRGTVKIVVETGGRYVLYTSAPGKVLLAHDGETRRRLTRRKLKRYTANTICDPRKLERELEKVRRLGYAVDCEEGSRGILCFAVPIRDHTRSVVATVGISVLTMNNSLKGMVRDLGPAVLEAGARISAALGFVGKTDEDSRGDSGVRGPRGTGG